MFICLEIDDFSVAAAAAGGCNHKNARSTECIGTRYKASNVSLFIGVFHLSLLVFEMDEH